MFEQIIQSIHGIRSLFPVVPFFLLLSWIFSANMSTFEHINTQSLTFSSTKKKVVLCVVADFNSGFFMTNLTRCGSLHRKVGGLHE